MALPEDTILENRYRIDRLLGQGGMGAIYRGFDTRLKRKIAIKENFFQTPQAIQQFEREAVMLADLTHPNLPRVGDHFSFEGQQYLVMDFIEGQDLWEMVKQQGQPLNEAQALDYIIQVCGAVQYLHERNPPIIHRDIKPQNIKITPKGRAALVDFGIAKMAEEGQRTSTGARGVTPGFSPLEQYSGSGTSPVSDVYSLGATLYAILTGQKPPDSAGRMVNQAKFVPPVKLNADLSERVSQAIEYAMQPQPADRPQSVSAWRQELGTIQDRTVEARPDEVETIYASTVKTPAPIAASSISPAIKSSLPWVLIGAGVVALLVVGGAIAFFALSGGSAPLAATTEVATPVEERTDEVAIAPTEAVEVDIEATIAAAVAATEAAQGNDRADVDTEATVDAAIAATKQAEPTDTPLPPTDTPPPIPPTDTPPPRPTNTDLPPTPAPATSVPLTATPMTIVSEPRILFDDAHNGQLTLDPLVAASHSPDHPEWFYAPDLARLIRQRYVLDQWTDGAITPEALTDYRVLVLGAPTDSYSLKEVQIIENFVSSGGGLLVFGNCCVQQANPVIAPLGARFGENTIASNIPVGDAQTFEVNVTSNDPLLTGISEVRINWSVHLELDDPANAILSTDTNTWLDSDNEGIQDSEEKIGPFPVVAKIRYEQGRVVIISDNAFTDTISSLNNITLVLQALEWLVSGL